MLLGTNYAFRLSATNYAQNYASIIGKSLNHAPSYNYKTVLASFVTDTSQHII